MKRSAIIALLAAFLGGCAGSQATITAELPSAEIQLETQTATETLATETTQFVVPTIEIIPPLYDLDVRFDYTGHNLQVIEGITYTNNSNEDITELQMVVEAQRSGANFVLAGIQIDGNEIDDYELANGMLSIALLDALDAGEAIQLELNYELVLPAGAGTLSWTDRQTNLIDWYPYLPPYVGGQGWLIHEPASVGEHQAYESADFRVHLEVLNAPASLQVAAAAPAIASGDTFDYELLNARRFVWSASGQYELIEHESEGIPIAIYYFNEHRDAAEASLQTAEQAVATYSQLFGAYPYESLAIVDSLFFDGMESDAIFFLDQTYFLQYNYSPRNYLTMLTAHEVAHNWWFGQVGNDQALEPWLDEALCIYSEGLHYENNYPEMVDWWWEFRIDRFRPTGSVNSTIYDHAGFESYVQAVYMRGAQFVQRLRVAMGDPAFFAFIAEYASVGSEKIISGEDFFAAVSDQGSLDVDVVKADFFSE